MNPYACAGWSNPQNPWSINDVPWRPTALNPPTFGALPPQTQPTSFRDFEFRFVHQNVLNCDVIGPKDLKYFEIRTIGERTTISRSNGCLAIISWTLKPTLEFMAGCARVNQKINSFLSLSSDTMYRTMHFEGKTYAWLQRQSGDYFMYAYGSNPLENLVQICRSTDGTKVVLKMKSEAFQAGLIEPCTLATILLLSGFDID
ncbi:hypothetical protein CPB84DRAFT_1934474 [Gymnopilus junonius]|uniref:Uncharacterized protein n=1 Tax=Gymnopilus junonius TaxID=109634 RepID=A0A9P5NKS4_GYMJU|nr:hypothetical protein CPB84DRAFT_1934474 [Gymnopilus junonius]